MTVKFLGLNLLTLAALILAGCGTSPPVRYFQLEPRPVEAEQEKSSTELLAVGPLHIPDYLDRPQLVTRTASVEIAIDDYRRWAEPLKSALPRVVAANLSDMREGLAALDHRHDSFLQFDYRLLGNIQQFDVDESGRVLLTVHWWLQDNQGQTLIPSTAGRYQAEAEEAGNPVSSVEAMNRALELFSKDVAQALDAAL